MFRNKAERYLRFLAEARWAYSINVPGYCLLIPDLTGLHVVFKPRPCCSRLPLCSCGKRQVVLGTAKSLGKKHWESCAWTNSLDCRFLAYETKSWLNCCFFLMLGWHMGASSVWSTATLRQIGIQMHIMGHGLPSSVYHWVGFRQICLVWMQ